MRVPFQRVVVVVRPALVLAVRPTGIASPVLWTAMITNAARADWPGDVPIPEFEGKGLLAPSKVRTAKIATVVASDASPLSMLDEVSWATVRGLVRRALEPTGA